MPEVIKTQAMNKRLKSNVFFVLFCLAITSYRIQKNKQGQVLGVAVRVLPRTPASEHLALSQLHSKV